VYRLPRDSRDLQSHGGHPAPTKKKKLSMWWKRDRVALRCRVEGTKTISEETGGANQLILLPECLGEAATIKKKMQEDVSRRARRSLLRDLGARKAVTTLRFQNTNKKQRWRSVRAESQNEGRRKTGKIERTFLFVNEERDRRRGIAYNRRETFHQRSTSEKGGLRKSCESRQQGGAG